MLKRSHPRMLKLKKMICFLQKLILKWKFFMIKLQNKSSRKGVETSLHGIRHASCTTEHGLKALCTSFRTPGKNNSHSNWFWAERKKELSGFAIGVASMKAGERALLNVDWQLGYGEEGNFSFPNVPPRANLIYEAELIGFEEAKEGKARSDMTVDERIEAADRRRQGGNALFKEDKLAEAMQQYEMALAYMGDDFMFQLFGKYKDMATAVKNPCHLNMAQCLLKLNRYEEAIGQCNMVLAEDEKNIKALFRRGKARAALGQTDDAREDFQKVRKISPEDKAVIRELRLLAEHDKQVYQKQKEMFKGLFGQKPEQKPKKLDWFVVFWQWLLSMIRTIFRMRSKTD